MVNCLLCEGRGLVDDSPEIAGECPECEGVGRVTKNERSRQEGDSKLLHGLLLDTVEAWIRRN